MTGTAETEAKEFWDIYELDVVVVVPTNKPVIRKDEDDWVFKTAREKYNAVTEEVEKTRCSRKTGACGNDNCGDLRACEPNASDEKQSSTKS